MASFQNLQKGSPKLIFEGMAPYILGLQIAADANFNLYKRDTLFTRIQFEGGFRYLLNHKDYLKISYINNSSRVNYVDLGFISREKRLPDFVDAKSNGIGFSLYADRTNYSIAPRKGWQTQLQSIYAKRTIKENLQIITYEDGTGFDYATLYDSFKTSQNQYKILAQVNYYQPLFKNIIGKINYQGAWMDGNNLFLNELYQIGGYNSIRGFDEESIYACHYHIASAEIRLMLNSNSYFYGFTDYGYVESFINKNNSSHNLWSWGGGIQLFNENGIFKIAIGVGKLSDAPFMLRQAKLHFGYTALF
jgi:outer membrane protein assembly factor BamA